MAVPLLPQNDPDTSRRRALLEDARSHYRYTYEALTPVATLAELPPAAHFDVRYNVLQLDTMSKIAANMASVEAKDALEPFDDLREYEDFYPVLPKPSSLANYRHDRSFGRQRVAGANPMVIRRVTEAEDLALFDLSLARLTAVTGFDSADAALASQRFFIADYRGFARFPTGNHGGRPKWISPAIALFYWRPAGITDRGGLAPVAIRLSPELGSVTPLDGARWQVAKVHVQVADANHHEMSTHLGRAHLVLEPFAIATLRQLAPNHPLRAILDPHLRFTLARNALARETLIRQDGPVDRMLAGTLEASIGVAVEAACTWHFEDFKLPNELKNRGVDDPDLLPDYPYRDDALLLWKAIGDFTLAYARVIYDSPAMVAADTELQAWIREIGAQDGGRTRGVPASLATAEEVAAALQQIIFISGPQHSAINFPQWDYIGAPVNMPFAAYASPFAAVDPAADIQQALLPLLPPVDQVRDQIEVMRFLSGFRYDRLGSYAPNQFLDPRALATVRDFQAALHQAEMRIQNRNARRSEPYEYLLPSNVLNSASI